MKHFIVLAALVAVAASTALEAGLRVTNTGVLNTSLIGSSILFDLPQNVSAAEAAGWTLTTRPEGPLASLTLYCAPNRSVCTLHEADNGHVAGLQLAVDQSEFVNASFAWEPQGFVSWTPSDDGKTYWAIQQYFVDEDYLALSAEERESSRNSSKTLQRDAIWVTGNGNKLIKMATDTTELTANNFVRQNCYPWMGYHYYLNMSTSLECTAETLMPWFGLVDNNELIGSGLIMYGDLPLNPVREWFERQTRAGVAYTIPEAPTCLLDLCDDPGLVTMHIYYVNHPEQIACP